MIKEDMKKICYIIGASVTDGMYIDKRENDLIIAADAGLAALEKIGVTPDLAVGDFDSLGRIPDFENKICHPAEKDDTDTALALSEGMSRGYRTFVVYGGLGGRLDHTIANLQNFAGAADHGAVVWVWGEDNAVCVFGDEEELRFDSGMRGIVSVFSPSRTTGVDLEGFKYTLSGACLTSSVPLGVSNEFIGEPCRIRAVDGILMVMWNEDAESFVKRIR